MPDDRTETRKTLWGQSRTELYRAQAFDAEAERLENLLFGVREKAAECRSRAAKFVKAAEELGTLDRSEQPKVNASDVDPTAGLNPDFNWGGDP